MMSRKKRTEEDVCRIAKRRMGHAIGQLSAASRILKSKPATKAEGERLDETIAQVRVIHGIARKRCEPVPV